MITSTDQPKSVSIGPHGVGKPTRKLYRCGYRTAWSYDRFGVIGIVAMLVHATGAPALSAASSGVNFASQ
jgi:hypothetical protein